jgi:uncharacterized protein
LADIVISKDIDLEGKYFVTGFHGIGWTGYIANRFLVGKLGGERIGHLTYEGMRPVVRLWQKEISYPHDLFLAGDNVFLASEAPLPEEKTMEITRGIVEWMVESGIKTSIVIGGLTKAVRRPEDPPIMGVATSKAKPLMKKHDIPWMLDDLNIVGPLAGMLFHAERKGLPLLALLPFAESKPDRRAAAAAIAKLAEILEIEVNTQELIQAEDLERQIHRMVTAQLKSEEQQTHNYM